MIPYFTINLPSIFGLPIQIFGVMVALGFLAADHLGKKRAAKVGLDPHIMQNIILICIFGGIFFAHVFDTAFYEPRILFTDFREFLDFRTRLSSMGGIIGACFGSWIYLKIKKKSFFEYGDAVVFGFIPGFFLGRIGCFLVHDHPGKLTDFFLGVQYPGGTRHDLGLYDALWILLVWIVMIIVDRKIKVKPFHGFYILLSFSLYSIGRFFLDFLRIQESRMGALTFAQYVCILFVTFGALMMAYHTFFKKRAV